MRGVNILWAAIILSVAVALFIVKYEVQHVEDQLTLTHQSIAEQRESIHVLNAEWSYLNDPERLARLSKSHLGLVHLTPDRVIGMDRLPREPQLQRSALDGVAR